MFVSDGTEHIVHVSVFGVWHCCNLPHSYMSATGKERWVKPCGLKQQCHYNNSMMPYSWAWVFKLVNNLKSLIFMRNKGVGYTPANNIGGGDI